MVGSDEVWSLERIYLRHINELEGGAASLVSTSGYGKGKVSLLNRIDRRLRPERNRLYRKFNQVLLAAVKREEPDVLLVFKGMEVFPETLQRLKGKVLLANYNADHPFEYHFRGSGNQNVLQSIPLYDLHFSYSKAISQQLHDRFGVEAYWLPFGYDEGKLLSPQALDNLEEILRFGFIGNPDRRRVEVIRSLVEAAIPVDVYGENWEAFFPGLLPEALRLFPPVYGKQFAEVACRYRVQLNVFRPHNEGSHNMRTFEMPAAGAIMLAPRSEEHDFFFAEGKEAFFYDDLSHLRELARLLLDLTPKQALQIRKQGLERSEQSGYSYRSRTRQVVHTLQQELKIRSI
jgi:spore maturation protein CgeB